MGEGDRAAQSTAQEQLYRGPLYVDLKRVWGCGGGTYCGALPTTTCWGLSFLRCVTSFRSTCSPEMTSIPSVSIHDKKESEEEARCGSA